MQSGIPRRRGDGGAGGRWYLLRSISKQLEPLFNWSQTLRMKVLLQKQQQLLLLLVVCMLYAVRAAPSARIRCSTDENCDDEAVTVSCSNVTSYSPSNLSSACYCQSGNTYRCADLCQLDDRYDGDFCETVCPDFHRCTSDEAVTAIALAAVDSPSSDSGLKSFANVPPAAWYLALAFIPIVVVLGILFCRFYTGKKHVVVPAQESDAVTTAVELQEISSVSASSGDSDIDPDSEALVTVENVV